MTEMWERKWQRQDEIKFNAMKRRETQRRSRLRKKDEKAARRRHSVLAKLRRQHMWGMSS